MAQLATAVAQGDRIPIRDIYGETDIAETTLRKLRGDLEAVGTRYEMYLGQRLVSLEMFDNLMHARRQTAYDVEMESDLESDDPGEESSRWARGERPPWYEKKE